ncbi:MAG: class I SAM-dependent DNA methyltransferase [Sphingomonas sp.]
MLKRTRALWKRRAQARIFEMTGMQGLLDERWQHALEDHMGFRGQIPEHRRFQIDQLKKRGLKPASSLLEIGCGPLTLGIPAIDYLDAGHYVGVDVRSEVLNMSWQEVGRAELSGKNPRLICSDNFGSESLGDGTFDFIWSFSVLFHLSDDILDRLFGFVAERLSPGGLFFGNVQTFMESSTWLQFPFLKRSLEDYETSAARHGLKMKRHGTLEELGFRLDRAERMNDLLQWTRAP